jgi:hypothetical protein
MKDSKWLELRGQTSAVDCSKNIISLEFFADFLFQDKKLGRFGVATPRIKLTISFVTFYLGKC